MFDIFGNKFFNEIMVKNLILILEMILGGNVENPFDDKHEVHVLKM